MFFRKKQTFADKLYLHILDQANPLLKRLDRCDLGFGNLYLSHMLPFTKNFLSYVLDLPASAEYHHEYAGGLFMHSLEAAVLAAEEYKRHPFLPEDELDRTTAHPKWQHTLFIATLLHDIGKVLCVKVVSDNPSDKDVPGEIAPVWNPLFEGLYDFVKREAHHVIIWEEGLYEDHNLYPLHFLSYIIKRTDLTFIGMNCFRSLVDSLLPVGVLDNNPLRTNIKKVDSFSTGKAHDKKLDVVSERKRFIKAFIKTIRHFRAVSKHGYQPNYSGSRYYVGSEYTAFCSPNVIRDILASGMDGYSFPDDTVPTEAQTQHDLVVENVCRTFGPNKDKLWKVRLHPKIVKEGKKEQYDLSVMFLRNEIIWGDQSLPLYDGTFEIIEGEKFKFIKEPAGDQ